MYRLVKLEGIAPVTVADVATSQDWRALEKQRDGLTAASFTDGPGSLEKLRYGVWPI